MWLYARALQHIANKSKAPWSWSVALLGGSGGNATWHTSHANNIVGHKITERRTPTNWMGRTIARSVGACKYGSPPPPPPIFNPNTLAQRRTSSLYGGKINWPRSDACGFASAIDADSSWRARCCLRYRADWLSTCTVDVGISLNNGRMVGQYELQHTHPFTKSGRCDGKNMVACEREGPIGVWSHLPIA